MSEVAVALGNAGSLSTIKWNNNEYKVHFLDIARLENFSQWIFSSARNKLRIIKEDLTSEEYQSRLRELERRWEEGEYELTSETCQKIMKTLTGSCKLLSLILDMDSGEAIQYMGTHPEEASHIIQSVLSKSFPDSPKATPLV